MNYFDLYSSYPDPTIAAAWDSQVKEADKTPWLAEKLSQMRASCLRASRRVTRICAPCLAARGVPSSDELRVPANWPRFYRNTYSMADDGSSIGWLGLLPVLLYCSRWVKETATAATITVTTNNPNIIADGQCSLIEAIVNANNDSATHTDCAAGSGADTIVLPANANLILSAVDNFSSVTGLPSITSRITIEGNGATIARQAGAPYFGLIEVRGDLTLQSVTLSGGSFGVRNTGTLTVKNSIISGNSGGGVNNWFGTVTIENSTISGNTATSGGGVSSYGGRVTITSSTISGNTASAGGGVNICSSDYGSSVTVNNSTITGNIASQGGGISNDNLDCGFYSYGASNLFLNNSLIAGNQAAVAPEIEHNTGCQGFFCHPHAISVNNFNLFGANGNAGVTGFTPGPTDIVPGVSLAQILGPLANNGGPTQTHALVAGSPAIDAGNPNGCLDNAGMLLPTDQRGFARHVDANNDGTVRCDIGAYEANAVIEQQRDFRVSAVYRFFGSGARRWGSFCLGECVEQRLVEGRSD